MAGLVKSITEVAKDDEKNIADLIEEQVQDTVKNSKIRNVYENMTTLGGMPEH